MFQGGGLLSAMKSKLGKSVLPHQRGQQSRGMPMRGTPRATGQQLMQGRRPQAQSMGLTPGGGLGMAQRQLSGMQSRLGPSAVRRPAQGAQSPLALAQASSQRLRAPQSAPNARMASYRGIPSGNRPNGLQGLAQARSRPFTDRLNRLQARFAKGGGVKKAVAALNRARKELNDSSDPSIDRIAKDLVKDAPQARRIATRMRAVDRAGPDADAEDVRQAWLEIHEELRQLQKRLSKD